MRDRKAQHLEQSAEKNCIRTDIITQFDTWVSWHRRQNGATAFNITAATLPGIEWIFEKALKSHIDTALINDPTRPTIQFLCAEANEGRAYASFRNMPDNCKMVLGFFSDLIKGNVLWNKSDYGHVIPEDVRSAKVNPPIINFAWPDLCCNPNAEFIDDFASMIANNMKNGGLAYITFCSLFRKKGGVTRDIIHGLFAKKGRGRLPITLHKAIHIALKEALVRYGVANRTELIYDVSYGGGPNRNKPMITIGLAVDLPPNTIPLIEGNRMRNPIRLLRYKTVMALEKNGWSRKWATPKAHRVDGVKSGDTGNIRFCRKVYKRWAKGMDANKIAKQLGVETRQVGATLAWLSPNLFSKTSGMKRRMMEQARTIRKQNGLRV